MKRVRIPGSKFDCCLEDEDNQYFLRLRINNKIEVESPVTHMDKKAIRINIQDLLKAVRLELNELQIDQIHKEIISHISEILGGGKDKERRYGLTNDPRVPNIITRIDELFQNVSKIEERLSKQEAKLAL